MTVLQDLDAWREHARTLEAQIEKVIVGQQRAIRLVTTALIAGGHVLFEGGVGVGKTTLLRAFARALGGGYERIEGTVDLMPNDLVYHAFIDPEGNPRVEPGPLVRRGTDLAVFFFNEINRARPQVQALLLRSMAERTVAAFSREHPLPYMTVFADRNRVEREETFELASAARDRFMIEVAIDPPQDPEMRWRLMSDPQFQDTDRLIEQVAPGLIDFRALPAVSLQVQQSVQTNEALRRYGLALWDALTQPHAHGVRLDGVDVRRLVAAGASPRGMAMLMRMARARAWLDGRMHVTPEDLRDPWREVMAHRIVFEPVYELRRAELAPAFLQQVLDRVPAP